MRESIDSQDMSDTEQADTGAAAPVVLSQQQEI